jgi:hypothetical protein
VENLPKSRKEAKEQGLTKYFTGKPCKKGHLDRRYTASYTCVVCAREKQAQWQRDNKDKWARRMRQYRRDKGDEFNAMMRRYYRNNPGPAKASAMKRYAAKRNRALWGQEEIKQIYLNVPEGHEVDHILPINGLQVCGLHVPENLRYIPKHENRSKSNRLLPEFAQQ